MIYKEKYGFYIMIIWSEWAIPGTFFIDFEGIDIGLNIGPLLIGWAQE